MAKNPQNNFNKKKPMRKTPKTKTNREKDIKDGQSVFKIRNLKTHKYAEKGHWNFGRFGETWNLLCYVFSHLKHAYKNKRNVRQMLEELEIIEYRLTEVRRVPLKKILDKGYGIMQLNEIKDLGNFDDDSKHEHIYKAVLDK